jgi:N-formylglutamate amidohydrolase
MARVGMGAIYTRTSTGRPLRLDPTSVERAGLLSRFYHPHHARLAFAVELALAQEGYCLLLDCHSLPADARPYELHHVEPRPDICPGTDAFHAPAWLVDVARSAFAREGHSVAVDAPYAGTIVPLTYYRSNPKVLSTMLEVNRRLYVDEHTGHRLASFDRYKAAVLRVTHAIAAEMPPGIRARW